MPFLSLFTFQSGDIRISLKRDIIKRRIKFTFQSGDIRIKTKTYKNFAYVAFTFQSGDIRIKIFKNESDNTNVIYIPIW